MVCTKTTILTRLIWLPLLASFGPVVTAWDYSLNGANWGGQCAGSGPQSPVDLPLAASADEAQKLFLKYPAIDSSFPLYHNGYSIALTLPESYKGGFGLGEKLDDLDSKDASAYRLWQINFHAPSEHTLQGRKMPLEMQMMHQRVTGGSSETAVVVVLFEDAANAYLDVLGKFMKDGLPKEAWEEKVIPDGVELGDLVGGSPFYNYEGSLTVPPCESSVKYYVRQEPIPAANAQLRQFQKILKDTCKPKGNFRIMHPLTGSLSLIASVDVVKNPDKVVEPKISKADTSEGQAPIQTSKASDFHCPPAFFDEAMHHRFRIRVGESPEMAEAKEKYNRAVRERQVAEVSEGRALRAYNIQKGLYASAPGISEKINLKWSLAGAESVYTGAKATLASVSASAPAEDEAFREAIFDECKREHDRKMEEAAKDDPVPAAPAPPAPPPKTEYPEPHVKLPVGLAASPFAGKDEDDAPMEAGVTAGEGDTAASLSKISPNLHQPDTAPSGSITSAVVKEEKMKEEAPVPEIVLSIDLPIAEEKMGDKGTFTEELVESLGQSVDISPSRLEVEEVKHHAVAKVHASVSLIQQMPGAPADLKGTYLRSGRLR